MTDSLAKLEPTTLAEAARLAQMLSAARGSFLPSHYSNEGEVIAAMMTARELGIPIMAGLRGIHVIKGKVGLSYELQIALLKRGGYRIEWLEKSDTSCTLKLTDPHGATDITTWDEARARRAKLWGNAGPWSQHPQVMLMARCVSSAVRGFASEVANGAAVGIYGVDEIDEIRRNTSGPERVDVIDHEPKHLTEGTLQHDARADNPEAYDKAVERQEAARAWSREFFLEHEAWLDGMKADPDPEDIHDWCQDHVEEILNLEPNEKKKVATRLKPWMQLVGMTERGAFAAYLGRLREADGPDDVPCPMPSSRGRLRSEHR